MLLRWRGSGKGPQASPVTHMEIAVGEMKYSLVSPILSLSPKQKVQHPEPSVVFS